MLAADMGGPHAPGRSPGQPNGACLQYLSAVMKAYTSAWVHAPQSRPARTTQREHACTRPRRHPVHQSAPCWLSSGALSSMQDHGLERFEGSGWHSLNSHMLWLRGAH